MRHSTRWLSLATSATFLATLHPEIASSRSSARFIQTQPPLADSSLHISPNSPNNHILGYQEILKNQNSPSEHKISSLDIDVYSIISLSLSLLVNTQSKPFLNSVSDLNKTLQSMKLGKQEADSQEKVRQRLQELLTLAVSTLRSARSPEEYQQAISYAQQSLELAQEAQDREFEAGSLLVIYYSLSRISLAEGGFQSTLEYATQGLEFAQEIQSKDFEGKLIFIIALCNLSLATSVDDYRIALSYAQQSLELAQEIQNKEIEAGLLWVIAAASIQLATSRDEYQQSLNYAQRGLELAQEIQNKFFEAGSLLVIATASTQLATFPNEYQEALQYAQRSLEFAQEIQNKAFEAGSLLLIASARYQLSTSRDEYQEALQYAQKSLEFAQEIKNKDLEAGSLVTISQVTYQLAISVSEHEQSIEYGRRALEIFRESGNRAYESRVLISLANTYHDLTDISEALELARQGYSISQEINNPMLLAESSMMLALLYSDLGQNEKALALVDEGLEIYRDLDTNSLHLMLPLLYRSMVLFRLSRPHEALNSAQEALETSFVVEESSESYKFLKGLSFLFLSIVHASLEDQGKAIYYAGQSWEALSNAEVVSAPLLTALADIHHRFGYAEIATRQYQEALALNARNDIPGDNAIIYAGLARINRDMGQLDVAAAYYKEAINGIEQVRVKLYGLSSQLQSSVLTNIISANGSSAADIYRELADLLLARGDILGAQRILELLKVQELQEFTRSRVTNLETRDYELDAAEKTVIDAHISLVAFGLKRSECVASPDCSDANLDRQYEQLSAAYTQAVSQLTAQRRAEQEARARRADGQLLQARQELSPEGFAGTAGVLTRNHPGTVLVYPVVLDDQLWVLWGSAGGVVSAVEVPAGRQRIGDAVLRFRQLMTACERGGCDAHDIPAVQAVAQELYQYIIPAPLEEELQALQATLPEGQVPNLVIVPDLVTRYIPFAALHDGQQYLIEKYAISTLLGAEQTTADNPLTSIDSTSILGLGLSNPVPEHGFPFPLENVPTELAAIVQTSATEPGIFRGETHLNETFDSEKLRLARRHQVLHLATHGVFDPKADSLSFLMLGVGQPLYIRDLQTAQAYFQNLSLVVLSACETALSDIDQSGLELASIASTFLQARVDTVVASLWQVSDSATSDLMQQFYGSLAQSTPEQRVSVGQALRQAQLAMLYGNEAADPTSRASIAIETTGTGAEASDLPRTAHPYYWSAFTIIGNGL